MKNLGAQIKNISLFVPEFQPAACKIESNTSQEKFFIGPQERRFAWPKYSSANLGAKAIEKLIFSSGIDKKNIDLLLYSAALNDRSKPAIGAELIKLADIEHAHVIQIDTGCASYLSLLKVADALLSEGSYKNAILVTVTNFISRLDEFQKNKKSFVLGDGATATLVSKGPSSILSSVEHVHGENYGLMQCKPKIGDFFGVGNIPLSMEFSRPFLRKLHDDSIEFVSTAVKEAIDKARLSVSDIDCFFSHQPNRDLINKWRSALSFKDSQVFDTFDQFGNLFQSSIPASLAVAIEGGRIKEKDVIALGTFSNGADFVASMVLRV